MNILLLSLLVSSVLTSTAHLAVASDELEQAASRFEKQMAGGQAGYIVQPGSFMFFTSDKCAQLETCFGNNPAAPYGIPLIPTPEVLPNPLAIFDEGDKRTAWQLREDEAIVLFTRTPPHMQYFGYTLYLYDHADQRKKQGLMVSASFGSLEDTLNLKTIQVSKTSPQDDVFNKMALIVVTADQDLFKDIRKQAIASGFSDAGINVLPIPVTFPVPGLPREGKIQMGLNPQGVRFNVLQRLGVGADPQLLQAYLQGKNNLTFKISRQAEKPSSQISYFSAPALRAPGNKVCEGPTSETPCTTIKDPNLNKRMNQLVATIQKRFANNGYTFEEQTVKVVHTPPIKNAAEGRVCNALKYNCLADNRDAVYTTDLSSFTLPESPDEFVFVVGVDHSHPAFGKASYVSHGLYRMKTQSGVGSFSSPKFQENGISSAAYYANANNGEFEGLYAIKVARDCGGDKFCLKIDSQGMLGVPVDETMLLSGRIYLEPATNVRPLVSELQLERVFRFHR